MSFFSLIRKRRTISQDRVPVSFSPVDLDKVKDDERYATWVRNHGWTERNRNWCLKQASHFTYRPLIGILMQCHNPRPQFLTESLSSIFNQIYPFDELSIVDRGSADEVKQLLGKIEMDPRVKVSYQKGLERDISAIAKIMKKAEAEWLLLMEAEDVLEPYTLYNMVAYLQNTSEIDFVFSDSDLIDDEGYRFAPQFKPVWAVGSYYQLGYYQHPILLHRRQIDKLRGYERASSLVEEGTLLDEASNYSRYVVQAPGILYHGRKRGASNETPPQPEQNVLMSEQLTVVSDKPVIHTELRVKAEPKVPLRILYLVDSFDMEDGPLATFRYVRFLTAESKHQFTIVCRQEGPLRKAYEEIGAAIFTSSPENLLSELKALHQRAPWEVAMIDSTGYEWIDRVVLPLQIPAVWLPGIGPRNENSEVHREWAKRLQEVATVMFLTDEDADEFRTFDSNSVCRVLPTGVDLAKMKIYKQKHSPIEFRKQFGIPPSAIVFAIAGPTIEQKGQTVFVQAALETCKRNPDGDFAFVIAGERTGPYLDEVRQMIARSDYASRFHLFPETDDPFQYLPYLLVADVLISCSSRELYPLTLLEAMAMKKAVIGTNVCNSKELIEPEENGFLVSPDDSSELTEKIDHLVKNPELFEFFGRRSLEIIYEKFQYRKIAARLEDLIRESIVWEAGEVST